MRSIDILRHHGLHQTPVRVLLVTLFNEAQRPLSVKEIEELLPQKQDRVTLYRTLKLFVEKKIVNRIEVSDSLAAYRMNEDDKHMHFYCTCCNAVYCLPQMPVVPVDVPDGFVVYENKFVVNGVCSHCNVAKGI